MTYPNAVFSTFAFMGFLMCAIPLPWHLQVWNTGTCLFMVWTGIGCLNYFINSIIWNRNVINWAPVWCDISIRIIIGCAFAIPAAVLCTSRRLYHIASVRTVIITKSEKRRAVMIDLAIGIGLPILGMTFSYIPQGHRFNIYEDIGCFPFIYYVWPVYPILFLPPIFIGLVSGTYATLAIIAFHKKRSQFNILLSRHSNLTAHRYIRLMCIAGADILFIIPVNLMIISLQVRVTGLNPWISWANVHADFSRVDQIPALLWRSPRNRIFEIGVESSRWSMVFCAFVFFGFFGFSNEAKKNYRCAFQSVAKRIGICRRLGDDASTPQLPRPFHHPSRRVEITGEDTEATSVSSSPPIIPS